MSFLAENIKPVFGWLIDQGHEAQERCRRGYGALPSAGFFKLHHW